MRGAKTATKTALSKPCHHPIFRRMSQVNISLPDDLAHWVQSCVDDGRYSKPSDYVRDLIRKDRDYEAKRLQFRAELQKGLDSGACPQSLKQIHAEYRSQA